MHGGAPAGSSPMVGKIAPVAAVPYPIVVEAGNTGDIPAGIVAVINSLAGIESGSSGSRYILHHQVYAIYRTRSLADGGLGAGHGTVQGNGGRLGAVEVQVGKNRSGFTGFKAYTGTRLKSEHIKGIAALHGGRAG